MAFRGIDVRELYRAGSGLTPRRLLVLIRGLPGDATLWVRMRAADEARDAAALKAKHEANKAYYARRAEEVSP